MGTIGHLMSGSGLAEVLEMVYAPNAVQHILATLNPINSDNI